MDSLNWNSAQSLFLQYLRQERNLSEETLRAYANDLRQFAEYVAGLTGSSIVEVKQISAEIVRGYLASVHKTLEKTSRARKLSALRSFYRYLNSAGMFSENPAELVASSQDKTKNAFLSPGGRTSSTFLISCRALRSSTGVPGERPVTGRMFESLYSTGVRVSELVKLDLAGVASPSRLPSA